MNLNIHHYKDTIDFMKKQIRFGGTFVAALFIGLGLMTLGSGCNSSGDENAVNEKASAEDEHNHDHRTGPHGGHFFVIDDLPYETEWTHDDEFSNVRVYFLNAEHGDAFVSVEKVVMISEGKETLSYDLVPELPQTDGTCSVFVHQSPALLAAVGTGVTVSVEIDGTTYSGKIEPHAHH